jgi:primosomal protein N' (replication factor Y)
MDNMLGMGDYRAREKALSTLIQIAGRSGRKSDATVVVQTFHEDFFAPFVENYEAFLEEEKFFREALYPPYKRLARVLFSHKNRSKAQTQMQQMKHSLMQLPFVEVVGSGECAINKVANKHRFEILLRAEKAVDLIKAIRMTKTELAEVDMDPLEFS